MMNKFHLYTLLVHQYLQTETGLRQDIRFEIRGGIIKALLS